MRGPRVFIASSSEGLDVAKAVRGLLLQELDGKGEISLWTGKFEFSSTYIESLETASRETDFAVLVLTPDDVTTSREAEKPAPRDNVVFELGLFVGTLGRDRCFLVHEQRADLKLPTDLLGVKAATFELSPNRDLKAALAAQCFSIGERITKLSSRPQIRELGNVFWLGLDLARSIRFAMFGADTRDGLEKELRQAIHHMDEVGLLVPDARKLLLSAIKVARAKTSFTEDERTEITDAIAVAKNDIGNSIAQLQPGFRGYATIKSRQELNRELEELKPELSVSSAANRLA